MLLKYQKIGHCTSLGDKVFDIDQAWGLFYSMSDVLDIDDNKKYFVMETEIPHKSRENAFELLFTLYEVIE